MSRVLITGARSPAALDIARDFARLGHEVHMADSSPARISRWSKAVHRFHPLRPPVQDAAGFRADVSRLVAELQPIALVPTCEEVFHLAVAREADEAVVPLFAPPMAILDDLHAKDRFAALATSLGLDVPQTRLLTSQDEVADLDFDALVLKACYSRFGSATLVRPKPGQVLNLDPTSCRPWIAQQHIAGQEHSSYAVAVAGKITAFAAYHSTMRLRGGAGYAFQPAATAVHDRMLEASRRLAAHHHITGQISLDAIDDGNRSWLIECNPRATSGAHLLSGSGDLARAILGEEVTGQRRSASRHNLPMMLSYGLFDAVRMLPTFKAGRDIVGAPRDRLPLLGALADTASFARQALKHRTSLTGATTIDIEWNGQR